MENKGLLFIPDIGGFSRFISETEIRHSRLIMRELFEVLISANEIGLEVSETDGDAIFFYKFGEPLALELVYKQVEKMFFAFHQNLIGYEQHRYCQCQACISAKELTLKVISHYGEFTSCNIKNFTKLIGKDLIIAHKLLKNDVGHHEYWMVTCNLSGGRKPMNFTKWMHWRSGVKRSEVGDILFHYTLLNLLKEKLPPAPPTILDLKKKVKVLWVERVYEADIATLCRVAGDFQYRGRWLDGVKQVETLNHWLPRVGMKCRYILENKAFLVSSTSFHFQDGFIQYSEMDEPGDHLTVFTLESITAERTRLTIDYYLKHNVFSEAMFSLFRKRKLGERLEKSMDRLAGILKELKQPQRIREHA